MKKTILIYLLIPFFGYSQITVTNSNLPVIGDSVITALDYGNFSTGNSGGNQYWNFASANGSIDMLLGFIDPSITPYANNFTSSNLCAKIDSASYYYLKSSIDGLEAIGIADQGIIFPFNKTILPTPLNYQDTISNTRIIFQFDTLLSPPLPSWWFNINGPYTVDSLKQIVGINEKFIVDGWGQIETPTGVYDALRVYETNYNFENSLFKITDTITGQSQWILDSTASSLSFDEAKYVWRTNDSAVNFSVAEMTLDSLGNSLGELIYYLGNSINNIVISPPFVEEDGVIDNDCFGYSNGKIMIDIIGTEFPFTYSWSGPNGFSSTDEDIYNLSAGTYTVTVTDANGNISIESYTITEPDELLISINQNQLVLNSIGVGGTAPYTYLWSPNNESTQSININSNGLFTCTITDSKGCTSSNSININNIPTNISETISEKKLVKVVDVLGRKNNKNTQTKIHIYSDGSVEKKVYIQK